MTVKKLRHFMFVRLYSYHLTTYLYLMLVYSDYVFLSFYRLKRKLTTEVSFKFTSNGCQIPPIKLFIKESLLSYSERLQIFL